MIHVIAILAVWRVAKLIAEENGPWGIITKFKDKFTSELFTCIYCLSIWLGLVAALMNIGFEPEFIIYGLGYAGGAVLIEEYKHW